MKRALFNFLAILISMLFSINIFADDIMENKITVTTNGLTSTLIVSCEGKINTVTVLYKYKYKAFNGKILDYFCQDILCYTSGKIYKSNSDFGADLFIREYKGYYYTYGFSYLGGMSEENSFATATTANYIIDLGENSVDPQSYFHEKSQSILEQLIDGSPITDISGVQAIYDGNLNAFDNEGNIVPKEVVYDLEIPLNFKVKQKSLLDLGFVEVGKDDIFYLTWEQSENINNLGWQTEIYYKEKGKAKKEWYSVSKKNYELSWTYWDSVDNYKLKYAFDSSKTPITQECIDLLGFKPYECSITKLDFMIRNKYVDTVNGVTHYSNYVYLDNTNGSGSAGSDMGFNAYEIDGSALDNSPDGLITDNSINNNRIVDSDFYNGNEVSLDKLDDNTSFKGGLSVIKSLFLEVKQFPAFLSEMFQFLPSELIYCLTALLLILIPLCVIKLVL